MIVWTEEARADLGAQIEWLREHDPSMAERVGESILESVTHVGTYPGIGRPGRRAGTREWVTATRRYVVVYTLVGADVIILRVLHGAQLWPPPDEVS